MRQHWRDACRVFDRVARSVAKVAGSPVAVLTSMVMVVVWALAGPWLDFSEAWQLTINTTTTIITFLMIFLLQHTQNAHDVAIHAKLDEIIHATHGARDDLARIEDAPEEDIERLRDHEE